ncbi:NmrA domain-containing protein [Trichoderma simmonsii]|uniref:NmrA domain-containing protein n=1 Tax=Trichoderma simmonsii TaxID=1491479 RepID=A0A8G0LDE1_9HYPO|nr:NmrA domain-containing protein [Trichoderma simmonsii]
MVAKKLVTVVGATGAQGGSVVDYLLKNKSKEYDIRAVTRSTESAAAKALAARGVEVVQAELTDTAALKAAFAGSYAIFAVTNFWGLFSDVQKQFPEQKDVTLLAGQAAAIETQMGINMVDAASATDTLQHYIWSTLTDAYTVSGGRIKPPHYESKAQVTRYIQSKPGLLTKTTFVWCAYYATNFAGLTRPIYVPASGQYIQIQATPPDQPIACIGNTRSNFGIFVEAALAQPDKTRGGQTVFAFVEITTLGGLLQTWAEAHNVKATYIQVSRETLFSSWPMEVQEFTVGMEFWNMIRDKEWTGKDRFLTYSDLGVDVTTLKSVKESFAELEL